MTTARELLVELADKSVVELADKMVAEGTASWQPDPYVEGVVGLLLTGTNRAMIVLYPKDQDFELDRTFEELLEK